MIKHPTEARIYRLIGRIDGLFNRCPNGWGPRDKLDVLEPLIAPFAQGRIRARYIHLPLSACTVAMLDDRFSCSESLAHMQMKAAAVLWMRAEGARDAASEQLCLIGRADAYSEQASWAVECGHTAMKKLATAVASPEPIRFTLIPFQEQFWRNGKIRRLVAVEFEWDADVTDEVAAFERERTLQLLATMPDWSVKRSPLTPRTTGGVR